MATHLVINEIFNPGPNWQISFSNLENMITSQTYLIYTSNIHLDEGCFHFLLLTFV